MPKRRRLAERLESKIEKGAPGGCWLWTGCATGRGKTDPRGYHVGGYGQIRVRKSEVARGGSDSEWMTTQVHRAAYAVWVGDLVPGMHVHHTCENKLCCNPSHLVQMEPSSHKARHYPPEDRVWKPGEEEAALEAWANSLRAMLGS